MPDLQPIVQRITTKYDPTGIAQFLKGLGNIPAAAVLAVGAVGAVGGAVATMVNDTMQYAETVRTLSRNIGISASESSKLLQIGDDYQISTDKMTAAMQMAVKNGFIPSIANLQKLSDTYLAYSDPVERAAALTEIFGKNWTTLTPILADGSDAIKSAADQAELFGLVLSQEDVDASRKLVVELDNLNDQWEAIGLKVGTFLIPILGDAAEAINTITTASANLNNVLDDHIDQVARSSASWKEYALEVMRSTLVTEGNSKATAEILAKHDLEAYSIEVLAKKYGIMTEAERKAYQAMSLGNQYLMEMPDYAARAASGMRGLADATDEAADAQKDYTSDLNNALSVAQEMGDFLDTLKSLELQLAATPLWDVKGIADLKTRIAELKEAHRLAVQEMIAGMYQVSLAADGVFDAADMQKMLDYRLTLGLMSKAEYDAAQNAIALANAIAALQDKHITVTTTMITIMQEQIDAMQSETSHYGTTTTKAASGGQLGKGWTMVGEEGFELISPTGMVIPHKRSVEMLGKGLPNVTGMSMGGGGGNFGSTSGRGLGGSLPTDADGNPLPYDADGNSGGGSSVGSGSSDAQWSASSAAAQGASSAAQQASSAAQQASSAATSMARSAEKTSQAQRESEQTNLRQEGLLREIKDLLERNNYTIVSEFKKFAT